MMKKEGFTLVELLAVIAILAILVIIVLPNVLILFNSAKEKTFQNELVSIYDAAEEVYVKDTFDEGGSKTYAHLESSECSNDLNLTGRNNIDYYIEIDGQGKVVKYYAKDDNYQYSYEGEGLKKTDINNIESASSDNLISFSCETVIASGNNNNNPELGNLYSTFVNELNSGSGIVAKYNGEHKDSFTRNPSKDIYYYTTADQNDKDTAAIINNKRNVLFANFCWEMYRTTDTGGVKLLYNGSPTSDGKCPKNDNNTIGSGPYANVYMTLGAVGYMNNSSGYDNTTNQITSEATNFGDWKYMNTTNNYYYGDKIVWDGSYYYLQNNDGSIPSKINWTRTSSTNTQLEGKYTCMSTASSNITHNGISVPSGTRCKSTYYVINSRFTDRMHYYKLTSGSMGFNDSFYLSPNFVKNNSTYQLDPNGLVNITIKDFSNNLDQYLHYYYCSNGNTTTCSESALYYIQRVRMNNRDRFPSVLKINHSFNKKYATNYVYENGKYKLSGDIIEAFDLLPIKEELNTHRYTCNSLSEECSSLKYINQYNHSVNSDKITLITLKNGLNVETTVRNTLTSNVKDSKVKAAIDNWYEENLSEYGSYLEETVFCNDRSFASINSLTPNVGSIFEIAYFNSYNSKSLKCNNDSDKFSIDNDNAKLKYSIGLITEPERRLMNNHDIWNSSSNIYNYYWTMTPASVYDTPLVCSASAASATESYSASGNSYSGYRPVISLNPDIKYSSGNGSMDEPYVIETN